MYNKIFIFLILTILININSYATIYWVGNSDNCTGSNVYPSLPAALLIASLSSDQADEIRLTETIDYVGSVRGDVDINNYNSLNAGILTIRGGYSDCFSATGNSRTFMGNTDDSIISINAGEVSTSITLRNLNLVNGAFRGIVLDGNVALTLDNVRIADNQSGLFVTGGAGVFVSADSIIEDNDKRLYEGEGGGIECQGANSYVELSGTLKNNTAERGGNLHIENGCFAVLNGGSVIQGLGSPLIALEGAGAYVGNGGELLSNGGANRVVFRDNSALQGAGLYVIGTGKATLLNTYFFDNYSQGIVDEMDGIIFAKDGGTSSIQVKMDRVDSCPFLISCSELDNNRFYNSLILADNSLVEINRSMVEGNEIDGSINNSVRRAFMIAINNAEIRLNRVAIFNHDSIRHLTFNDFSSKIKMSHVTVANNTYQFEGGGPFLDAYINLSLGQLSIENSIFKDTQLDPRVGDFSANCNLIDNNSNWPTGTYHIGTPVFNNLASGDPRQMSGSPAVDMCLQDSFAWSTERDIENQLAPVNDSTNQQGSPGHPDGMYDAGFDENYTSIGNDEFLLTVQKQGSGDGSIVSTPLGIACGSDCSEVYFNETLVTLFANADSESTFSGWVACPLANGNQCQTSMESSQTIIANFLLNDDIIFINGFE